MGLLLDFLRIFLLNLTWCYFGDQALAELYVIDGQYEKAFNLYADVSALPSVSIFNHVIELVPLLTIWKEVHVVLLRCTLVLYLISLLLYISAYEAGYI